MRKHWLWFVVLLPLMVAAIDDQAKLDDPKLQARYESINKELRCLVCQNQTIADSNAGLAKDLRRQVREMLEAGATDKEIMTFMTARYGDFVTYRPPWSPRTYVLWLAPAILLFLGAVVMVTVVRKRSRLPIGDEDDDEQEDFL